MRARQWCASECLDVLTKAVKAGDEKGEKREGVKHHRWRLPATATTCYNWSEGQTPWTQLCTQNLVVAYSCFTFVLYSSPQPLQTAASRAGPPQSGSARRMQGRGPSKPEPLTGHPRYEKARPGSLSLLAGLRGNKDPCVGKLLRHVPLPGLGQTSNSVCVLPADQRPQQWHVRVRAAGKGQADWGAHCVQVHRAWGQGMLGVDTVLTKRWGCWAAPHGARLTCQH